MEQLKQEAWTSLSVRGIVMWGYRDRRRRRAKKGTELLADMRAGKRKEGGRRRQGGQPPFYHSVMLCCPGMPRMSKQGSTLRAGRDLGFAGVAAFWAVTGSWGLQSHPAAFWAATGC